MTGNRSLDHFLEVMRSGSPSDQETLAQEIASAPERSEVVPRLLPYAEARRWIRSQLLGRLEPDEAAALAERLMTWWQDFDASHRDRTTPEVIRHLPLEAVLRHAPYLAGTNAAAALWERLAKENVELVVTAALDVLATGEPTARETTLHVLLLDPYSSLRLPPADPNRLLVAALDDPDPEIRGLAAELVAETAPERLLGDLERWTRDASERVRMAAWAVAFADDLEQAVEDAATLFADERAPVAARRSALIALGDHLPTDRLAPLLALAVVHPNQELAEDAADLLWTRHRTPMAAQAATQSPHPAVREVAQRLLHPEMGSPAAGGSRPGAPDRYDIYQQLLHELEEKREK